MEYRKTHTWGMDINDLVKHQNTTDKVYAGLTIGDRRPVSTKHQTAHRIYMLQFPL